jgi:hypothetical protein
MASDSAYITPRTTSVIRAIEDEILRLMKLETWFEENPIGITFDRGEFKFGKPYVKGDDELVDVEVVEVRVMATPDDDRNCFLYDLQYNGRLTLYRFTNKENKRDKFYAKHSIELKAIPSPQTKAA